MPNKQVLLIIIDGLSWGLIPEAIRKGRLPTLAALAESGRMQSCTSIYPSITPAATGSIVTGKGPAEHGVQGAFWFDRPRREVEYFGSAPAVMLREGLGEYFDDFLLTLNDELLGVPTIYEKAAVDGLRSAGLNLMWRRGGIAHDVQSSLLTDLMPGVQLASSVLGPEWLFQGEFVGTPLSGAPAPEIPGGASRRFGFNDDATRAMLEAFDLSDEEADLIVAYFPDNDFESHDHGAEQALPCVEKVDQALGALAQRHGGIAAWLETTAVVVVGDHGHNDLEPNADRRGIALEKLLEGRRFPAAGSDWREGDELMVCPNMRAAQVAVRPGDENALPRLAETILVDERIDQAVWFDPAERVFRVWTAERGRLTFAPHELSSGAPPAGWALATDDRGQSWRLNGELAVIGARIEERGGQDRLVTSEYPDALGRIAQGGPACQPALWLTARPGYEFTLPGTDLHDASSHGSLHRCDSESVLITAGLPAGVESPEFASITDITPLCLAALGVEQPQAKKLAAIS
ncbi:Phosphonoacetate hydrolase [Pseudobythopirellula maris]|uniref:Phosphonoacetate hydrolase n=1 Tax=Pseudobythopirellula maris TaxID=2527991 RepID=A0A5C5ZR84_9BACT|nr:alkaline phosphatase family protein [Pseudobythopirellula maris]TWT90062.1 Phosphonoacetate hydrolase [Pseudobythopirellula maris]